MSLKMIYKNELGEVVMHGAGTSELRVIGVEGLGLVEKEYRTAVFPGYNGQQTLGSRAVARTINIVLEAIGSDAEEVVRNALKVLGENGVLYIENGEIQRRIRCNQVYIPDVTRVLKKRIASFAVQLICDNPYFEDAIDTVVPIYHRDKLLATPFSLPAAFGRIVLGADINVRGAIPAEPVITLYYPVALVGEEYVEIINKTTGKTIRIEYKPQNNDTVVVDIKNRTVTSSVSGNIISCISDETFLGDFVLEEGNNFLMVEGGDITPDFTVECRYNNLYSEAVIV